MPPSPACAHPDMDERLFARLAARLREEAVVMASVLDTRGATPRKSGSRMLIGERDSEFSVGGGEAEARVIDAARSLLAGGKSHAEIAIDLGGGEGAAGICGGRMRIALRRWQGEIDGALAGDIAATLASGRTATLPATAIGSAAEDARLEPDVRLLIVGAGHCGRALFELARHLDFDLWVFDRRADCFASGAFADAQVLCGAPELLRRALDTPRVVFAVLLSRDFQSDVEALTVLAEQPPAFIGMMGSRRRVAQVMQELPPAAARLPITAPVGIELGEQTPHEIAVAVLAQLVRERCARRTSRM
jgi:xanthine dehydrogenase accessory factor